MTNVEKALVLGIKSIILFERDRYVNSLAYWTTGEGKDKKGAKKSVDFINGRISVLNTTINQIDLIASDPS